MTDPSPAATSSAVAWTCPFCALLCDEFSLVDAGSSPRLQGSDCPRARAALEAHGQRQAGATRALVDGAEADLDAAVAEAARRMGRWRQPLFGGLGTDIAGARALYRLALRTGAICDPAEGAALMTALRALQDRGQFTTTLQEVRTRADLILCVGTPANARFPEFFRRIGLHEPRSTPRALVFLDAQAPAGLPSGVDTEAVAGPLGLAGDLQQLAALAAGQHVPGSDADLTALAARLGAARYAVLVWEPGQLPAHGALLAELLQRLVATLNRSTRAASFALGGGDGAATVNQVFTWLSGLPLRTRAGASGLAHEPLRFDAGRLLADRAVDGLLWIASFDPARVPPAAAAGLPRIVLGPPAMAARLQAEGAARDTIFIPVATPGLNAAGHLFRTDGIVVVPLVAVRDDGLRGAGAVLAALAAALESPPAEARAPAPVKEAVR